MEILEQPDGQSCLLRLTKEEWIELGDDYGYLTPERQQQIFPPDDSPISPRYPMSGRMTDEQAMNQSKQWMLPYLTCPMTKRKLRP